MSADIQRRAGARASSDDNDVLATREKYRRIAEHRRYPKKKSYSFDDLALGLTAMEAGVNRYYAMAAGHPAKRVLNYLAQAAQAAKPDTKAKAIKLARKCLSDSSRERHPELAEQIESRILWEEGWRPETWDAERNAPRSQAPSVNPETGMQEFFWPFDKLDVTTPEGRFNAYRQGGQALGLDLATENINHYLGATGEDRWIDPQKLQSYPQIQETLQTNRNKFANGTFTDWTPETDQGRETLARLNAIKDGETINISNSWPANFGHLAGKGALDTISALTPRKFGGRPGGADLTAALGRSNLNSKGDFRVTRNGNLLNIEGDVTHSIHDAYDFDNSLPYGPDALELERAGKARPYLMKSQWSEPMSGTVQLVTDPDGKVRRVEPTFKWGR